MSSNAWAVYRRAPRPLAPDACPQCTRVISINSTGRRRNHRDLSGQDCTGSGVMVGETAVDLTDDLTDAIAQALAGVELTHSRWASRDRTKPANPWSGKA